MTGEATTGVIREIEEPKLQINFKKSSMMCMNQERELPNNGDWKVMRGRGKPPQTIKGINVYTYLGMQMGRSTGVKLHYKESIRTTTRQVNILKVKASQSFDRFLTGRVIWNQAIKQKGGTVIVHTPKSWTRETESTQNKVVKWLMPEADENRS